MEFSSRSYKIQPGSSTATNENRSDLIQVQTWKKFLGNIKAAEVVSWPREKS
jgi:hypothetical protein